MKSLTAALITLLFLSACGGDGASGTTNEGFPVVSGTYKRETTNCKQAFDTSITVVQDEDKIIIKGDSDEFLDVSGWVDKEGNFYASNVYVECNGQFVDGSATANCSVDTVDILLCVVTYSLK